MRIRKPHTFQPLSAQAKLYVPVVRRALVDFAAQMWGPAPVWRWSNRPVYTNNEATRFNYAWLGTISKTDYSTRPEWVTADEQLCTCLESGAQVGERFRVLVFRDYGYNQHDEVEGSFRAAYLTLTEVSLVTEPTDEGLRMGITQLYDTLKQQPVHLTLRGYDRPEPDTRTELVPGIEVWTRVLAKHT